MADGDTPATWGEIGRTFIAETAAALASALKWGFVLAIVGAAIWVTDLATRTIDEEGKIDGGLIHWLGTVSKFSAGTGGVSVERNVREVQQEQTRQIEDRTRQITEMRRQIAALEVVVERLEQGRGDGAPIASSAAPGTGDASAARSESIRLKGIEATTSLKPSGSVSDADVRLDELKVAQQIIRELPREGVLVCGIRTAKDRIDRMIGATDAAGRAVADPAGLKVGQQYRLTANAQLYSGPPSETTPMQDLRALPAGTLFTVRETPRFTPSGEVGFMLLEFKSEVCTIAVTLDQVPRLTDLYPPVQQMAQ